MTRPAQPGDLCMIIEPSAYGKQVTVICQCCSPDAFKVEALERISVVDEFPLAGITVSREVYTAPGEHFCIEKRWLVPLDPPPKEVPTNELQPLETELHS